MPAWPSSWFSVTNFNLGWIRVWVDKPGNESRLLGDLFVVAKIDKPNGQKVESLWASDQVMVDLLMDKTPRQAEVGWLIPVFIEVPPSLVVDKLVSNMLRVGNEALKKEQDSARRLGSKPPKHPNTFGSFGYFLCSGSIPKKLCWAGTG